MKNQTLILIAILLVVVTAGGFYAGTKFRSSSEVGLPIAEDRGLSDSVKAEDEFSLQDGRGVTTSQPASEKSMSADAREIVITGSGFSFDLKSITVKKGEKVRIVFKNEEGRHDWRVDEFSAHTAIIPDGTQDFVEFTPDKTGSFEYYCSVGNHRAMGMKGTLIVQ